MLYCKTASTVHCWPSGGTSLNYCLDNFVTHSLVLVIINIQRILHGGAKI